MYASIASAVFSKRKKKERKRNKNELHPTRITPTLDINQLDSLSSSKKKKQKRKR